MQNLSDLSYGLADWQMDEASSKKTVFAILTETPNDVTTTENAVLVSGNVNTLIQSLALAMIKDEKLKDIVRNAIILYTCHE